MYKIVFTKTVAKIYTKLTKAKKSKINKGISQISEDPRSHPNIKPLKGALSGIYRCRAGNMRIKYSIVDGESKVYILDIDYRGNIYK